MTRPLETDEQLANFKVDPDFALFAGDVGYLVVADGDDDHPWVVTRNEPDLDPVDLGTFETFPEAVASLGPVASKAGRQAPAAFTDGQPDSDEMTPLNPLAVFAQTDGGVICTFKMATDQFDAYEVAERGQQDPPLIATYEDLGTAITDLALPPFEDPV